MSVAFLPQAGTETLTVSMAWGADLSDLTGAGWTWTDVTSTVRYQDGINYSFGRGDEAGSAQPAACSLTFDNATFAYSLGPQSANYPNVRKNTPLRVSVGALVVFQGYVATWAPSWDNPAGKVPVVKVTAAGYLRRLAQRSDALRSSLYRYHTLVVTPSEYWPLEETKTALTGSNVATGSGAPATMVPLTSGAVTYGKVVWGGATDNPALERAVQVSAGGSLVCPIRVGQTGTGWSVAWSMKYTSKSGCWTDFFADDSKNSTHWRIIWDTGGNASLYVVDKNSSSNIINFVQGDNALWDDVWHDYLFTVDFGTTPGSTTTKIYRDGVQVGTNTASPGYAYQVNNLQFQSAANPTGTEDPVTVGHVAYFGSVGLSTTNLHAASIAHRGETVSDRLVRLCAQTGVALTVSGSTTGTMGPQRPLNLITLLRECEAVDQGLLFDGQSAGLYYSCRDNRESFNFSQTITAAQVTVSLPTDDDQRTVNRSTASGISGGKYTYADDTGALGTATVGVFESSIQVNPALEYEVLNYAQLQVALGTVAGYRFPAITVDMEQATNFTNRAAFFTKDPNQRFVLTNPSSALTGMPAADVNMMVEGVKGVLTPHAAYLTFACSPVEAWNVGILAADTGSTSTLVMRLESDGCTVASSASAGATTLSISTPSGPIWTTVADDYPLILSIGGYPITASACSGAGTTQTLTVTALPAALAAGTAVTLYRQPVLGL